MARTVAEGLWEMLASAGVRRCYGIVGDALNPVIDALRRNGSVDFVHVRHEEYGVFAAVAEARLTGNPVAVCGTAGPGVTHLINGLLDARKERVPVIAIAGDVESSLLDSDALEELNPYTFFAAAALYIGRLVSSGAAAVPGEHRDHHRCGRTGPGGHLAARRRGGRRCAVGLAAGAAACHEHRRGFRRGPGRHGLA